MLLGSIFTYLLAYCSVQNCIFGITKDYHNIFNDNLDLLNLTRIPSSEPPSNKYALIPK